MAVDPQTSRAIVLEELRRARDLARTHRWGIIPDRVDPRFLATMYAHNGDLFILDVECTDYREQPALFEFLDPDTGEPGTRHAYPRSNDSLFHDSGPCICAPFSRKAYGEVHRDWSLGQWAASKANNYDWSNVSTLGDALGLIQARLSSKERYLGRMG